MHPVVLYDGDCGFCNRAVLFIAARDRRERFRFAPLQSPFGARVRQKIAPESPDIDTIVLARQSSILTRSDAVLAIATELGWPWKLARIFALVPRAVRDAVYDLVARHRHRLIPGPARCVLPGELGGRLLPDDYDAPLPLLPPPHEERNTHPEHR